MVISPVPKGRLGDRAPCQPSLRDSMGLGIDHPTLKRQGQFMKVGKGARMPSSAWFRVALRGGYSRMRASALLHELALNDKR